MNDRPITSRGAISLPQPGQMDEEAPQLQQTGADFYLKMLEKMQAEHDPRLGDSFTAGPEEETPIDYSSMTLEQKLKDKNVKTKMAGIEELGAGFDTIEEKYIEMDYFQYIMEGLSNSMPSYQKACLDLCLKVVLEKNCSGWVNLKELAKQIAEKVLPSMKPQMKKPVMDLYVQVLKKLGKDEFTEAIKESLASKNPKVKGALMRVLTDLLSMVGQKDLNAVKLWDGMAKESDSFNPMIKKDFVAYSAEVYRWVGEAFSHKLVSIKKMTADEITKLYDEKKATDNGQQPLPTLDEFKQHYLAKKDGEGRTANPAAHRNEDSYDLFEAVDIFKIYNEKWSEKVLAEIKWIEKKKMTDDFIEHAQKNPRHTGNYFPIIQLSKRLIEDSNINVQSNAVKILTVISKGLRKELAREGRKIVGILLPKLKERKKLTDEILECLKTTVYYIQPYEIVDEYEAVFAPKNNLLKGNLLEWFIWYVSNSPENKVSSFLSAFNQLLIRLSDEGAVEIRDANLAVISKIINALGTNNEDVSRLLDKIPKAQLEKIQGDKSKLSTARTTSSPHKRLMVSNSPGKASKITIANINQSRNMDIEKPLKPSKKESTTSLIAPNETGFSQVRLDLNVELAVQNLSGKGITLDGFNSLSSQPWKSKVEYLQNLAQISKSSSSEGELEAVAILSTLLLKNFKESNPNLIKEYLTIMEDIFKEAKENLTGKFVYSFGWFLVEKYGDSKFLERQNAIIEEMGPVLRGKLVLSLCELISSKNPSPKTHSQLLSKLTELVEEEAKSLPHKEMLTCAKENLSNNNAGVREEASKFICALYKHFGEQIKKSITDLNPQLKKLIEAKLEKIEPVATEMDENAPRRDLSKELGKLILKMNDGKWLSRKDGLNEASKLIKASGRLSSKGLNDFATCLKNRLGDSNQVVARESLLLLKIYIKALGQEFKGQSRLLIPLVIPCLADKVDQAKDTAREILDLTQSLIGSEWILNTLVSHLTDSNSELAIKVFEYVSQDQVVPKLRKCDLKVLGKNIVTNLIHKNGAIRSAAEKLLDKICNFIPREGWNEICRDFNPATKSQVDIALNKHLPTNVETETHHHSFKSSLEIGQNFTRAMDIETSQISCEDFSVTIEKKTQRVKVASPSPLGGGITFKNQDSIGVAEERIEPEKLVAIITYSGPQDREIDNLREVLSKCFDDSTAEKMFSLQQSKIIESLSNLGLLRMTNPGKYTGILPLILNWVYVRVFDTNNKHTLDLFADFIITNLEEYASKRSPLGPDVQNKLLHCFAKILDHHPDKDYCLRLVGKFCFQIAKCPDIHVFFTILMDNIISHDIDPQIICILMTNLLDSVDLRKCISIRGLNNLERYTNGLLDITKNEIYHFYSKCLTILGSKFFEVFQFSDKRILQNLFDISNPEEKVPMQTMMMICLKRFQSNEREDKLRGMKDLSSVIEEGSDSMYREIKLNASLLGIALIELNNYLMDHLYDEEFSHAFTGFRNLVFSMKAFTLHLGSSSYQEIFDSMVNLLIKTIDESKRCGEEKSWIISRLAKSLNSTVINFNMAVKKSVCLPSLMDMVIINEKETVSKTQDYFKNKGTIINNCILNFLKSLKFTNEADLELVPLVLDRLQGFFSQVVQESSQVYKTLKTVVQTLTDMLRSDIWTHYESMMQKRSRTGEGADLTLSNLITGYLKLHQAAQQSEDLLFRRRRDMMHLEEKENREQRDVEIQKLSKEASNMVGLKADEPRNDTAAQQ
jgi:hypothetical protein